MVNITLKNYRCFSDTKPATVEIGPGFTAFVGPNNSGKSSFLKFFYEFQQFWNYLSNVANLANLATPPDTWRGIGGLRHVMDVQDISCDFTGRPLAMDFWLSRKPESECYLDSIVLRSQLNNPNSWNSKLAIAPKGCSLSTTQGEQMFNQNRTEITWQAFKETFEALQGCMYAPAFRNVINEGSGSFYDFVVGTSLVGLWNSWKAGESRTNKKIIQTITGDIQHIFNYRSLEINMSASGKSLEVIADGRPYRLNDMGAGLSQFIMLFANVAVRRPNFLLIDEPELNLHPSLQIDFLTSLASYTTTGSVIFATHSLGLARAVADRIFTFTPTKDGTVVAPFERTPNYAEFAGELSYSSFRELGFGGLLMVEGPSEVKAVQQFLRLLDLDHKIVVLHLGGSSMIAPGRQLELGELKRISDSIAVLIDSEKTAKDAELAAERLEFVHDCESLGFNVHVTELRAFENYLTDRAIKAIKGDSYRALMPYEKLKDAPLAWSKLENWRMARLMTKEELMSTDVGQFLDSLRS